MRYGNRDRLSGHTGGEICHFKLFSYLYLTIMWWERTQFSNSTLWRLVFSHSWFRIHLQLDFVSLEMNYEPLVWEHQSPKCFDGEPTTPRITTPHSAPLSHHYVKRRLEPLFSPTRDWEQHSRESVLLLLGWEQECSHIRVWEHPGEFWLVNQLYRPIRNVF